MARRIEIHSCFQEFTLMLDATKSVATARMYKHAIGRFQLRLKIQGLRWSTELKVSHCIAMVGSWGSEHLSTSSKRVYVSALTSFMSFMSTMDYWDTTFSDMERYHSSVKQWVGKKKGKEKIVKQEDIQNILRTAEDPRKHGAQSYEIFWRNLTIVHFLHSTGCRISELMKIRIMDIDFENLKVRIEGKGNKHRWIFFDEATKYWMYLYLDIRNVLDQTVSPLITKKGTHDDLSTSTVRKIIANLVKSAGLPKGSVTPHSFRHAFAVKMLEETGNLALVQDLLGHSSPETTRVYAKYSEKALQEEYNKIWRSDD